VVWHHSLPLVNSFNKTEAAVFPCRLCFLRAFPFISFFFYQLSYPGSSFLGSLLYITVLSCHKFIRFHLNHIRSVKEVCCTHLKEYMRTNQQDTDNDPKTVTDILTAICLIGIRLYIYTICCQDTCFDIHVFLKTASNILLYMENHMFQQNHV